MNERKTAKVKVGLSKTVFLVTAFLIIWSGSAGAQQSLRDLAKEYGADWLAGRWTATTDEGTTILLMYRWQLDGHLVTVDLKGKQTSPLANAKRNQTDNYSWKCDMPQIYRFTARAPSITESSTLLLLSLAAVMLKRQPHWRRTE